MRGHDRYGFRLACGNGDDFETFMVWMAAQTNPPALIQNQYNWQRGIKFDRILHLENLSEEFASLPFVNEPVVNLPEINTTLYNREPAQHHLTPRAIEAIRSWAKADFEKFGYSVDVPSRANQGNPKAGQC